MPEPTTAPVTADCVCGTCDMSTCSCDCHGIVDESATVVGGRRLGTAPVTAEDLRERIAWLRDRWYERPGLSEQADALDAALDEFAEDAARQAAEVERLRAAKRQLSERISIGQEGWNEIARERDALTTELEHARGNLTDARGEIDALTRENREQREELAKAEATIERLRDVNRTVAGERDAVTAELDKARNVITALPDPGTVEELREKITDLFGSPNEALVDAFLSYAWSETARIAGWEMVARWQTESEQEALKAAIEQVTSDWKLRARKATAWVGKAKNHVEEVRWNAWRTAYECLATELLAALAVPESTEEGGSDDD